MTYGHAYFTMFISSCPFHRVHFTLFVSLQVEVEVETMDKGGNFIGWLYVDGVNHSVTLVEEGLSKVRTMNNLTHLPHANL